MPLIFNEEAQEWEIYEPTKAEIQSLIAIGKRVIIHGLAGDLVNEKYKTFLTNTTKEEMFQA